MLVDSDVLIWFLKGNTKALIKLQQLDKIEISAISYMELIQGMRNKQELQTLQKTIQQFQWQIIPLDKQISDCATDYVEQFFLSHSLRFADALIAATAVKYNQTLLTANDKHYKMINELKLDIFRP